MIDFKNKITHNSTLVKLLSVFLVLLTFGCQQSPNEISSKEESDPHNHGEEVREDEVHLLQKQMEVMDIQLGKFQFHNLSTTVKANGQLELPPQKKASISAIQEGRIISINALEGDYIKKGQILARLEHPNIIKVQQEYLSAKSQEELTKKALERNQALYTDLLSSAKELEISQANYTDAKAKASGLKAHLQLLNINLSALEGGNFSTSIPIRSPINGYVRHIAINIGMYVNSEMELFEIVDNEHIHIDLMVYEKDLHKVKKGQKVIFSLINHPDSVFQGSIFALGKSFEQQPKAMVVHAEIDNKQGELLSGMYVDARIITNQEKVQALPDDAIVRDAGLDYIFVLKPASTQKQQDGKHQNEFVFRKIEVNTAAKDIGFTETIPVYNLPEHAQVVTKGAFYLLAEMKKGEGGHGHHH